MLQIKVNLEVQNSYKDFINLTDEANKFWNH